MPTKHEIDGSIDYIHDMARQLKVMANRSGSTVLPLLFDMITHETSAMRACRKPVVDALPSETRPAQDQG